MARADEGGTLRVVVTATNSGGSASASSDRTDAVPVLAPAVSKNVDVAPVSGTVLIKLPGGKGFIELKAGEQVPVGSTVDARHGEIRLTSALDAHGHTESDLFNGAEFVVGQGPGAHPVTTLALQDTGPACASAGTAGVGKKKPKAKSKKRSSPSLWGSGNGAFRTVGANGYGTERGTVWETQDRCTGTFFHVRTGLVQVVDLTRHRTLLLKAGGSYLAPAHT